MNDKIQIKCGLSGNDQNINEDEKCDINEKIIREYQHEKDKILNQNLKIIDDTREHEQFKMHEH